MVWSPHVPNDIVLLNLHSFDFPMVNQEISNFYVGSVRGDLDEF